MNVQVTPHRIILTKTSDVNSGEYNVNECTFEFSQEFDNLTCIAVFSLCDGTTRNITILNNRCIIPTEVLQQTGQVKIGVYGYSVQDDELVLRYSPTPQIFVVTEGSYKEGTEPVAPSPTDWEILVQQVSNNSRDISNIEEDITGINGEISGINIDIRDLQDTKANINDLASVAFSGSYTDLINKPDLSVYATKTDLSNEETARENADINLQNQIDAISVSSDVVDVVGTYQELLDYDTTHLKDNDIVKVLDDSTHNDALSYYRWDKETETWSYIGSEGPFYTKGETQELLNAKEDKITTTNKLDADLVDDSNSNNKFVTEEDITYWDNKEDKSNKVTEINSSSTDTQYPSAKCVYDSQNDQDTEIDTLKMIYNILPTDTDTGETISIDNTGEMPIKSISLGGNTTQEVIPAETGTNVNATSINISDVNTSKEHTIGIDGNTYQETTTGKNLLYLASQYDYGQNGVNGAYNETDGSFTITGTATASTNSQITRTIPLELTAGTYTFSLDHSISKQIYLHFNLVGSGGTTQNIVIPAGQTEVTDTLTADTTGYNIRFSTTNGATYDEKVYMQLESGSTPTTFEKFTYGASPNPSYPQNIEVVTGENTIVISNSDNSQSQSFPVNLGNIELCKISTYKDRIYKRNDKWYLEKQIGKVAITTNAYITHYGIWHWIGFNKPSNSIMFNDFNNYKLYMEKAYNADDRTKIYSYNTSVASSQMGVMCYEDDDATTLKQKLDGSLMYYPLATPTTTEITASNYPTLYSQLNALYNSTLYSTTNINTETSNLLPYIDLQYNVVTPAPSPQRASAINVVSGNNTIIICGKNLFNASLFDGITQNNDGTYKTTKYYTDTTTTIFKGIPNTQYTISFRDGTDLSSSGFSLSVNGTWVNIGQNGHKWTFTTDANGEVNLKLGASAYATIGGYNRFIQIEKSSTASTYQPYQSQTLHIALPNGMEMCKIGTYQDYIYKSGGNWYKKNAIAKTTDTTGSTSITINEMVNNGGMYSYYGGTLSGKTITYDSALLHDNVIYYPLATPTDTQITDTTLINQLNNIKKAYSYDTQTNISQTNEDKPFIITAEMFLSLKNVLN